MLNNFNNIIKFANDILWSRVLIILLISMGLYFTLKSDFVQIRFLKDMFKLLGEGATDSMSKDGKKEKGVSSFQAFCISTASRVGTGNLAGIAIAISLGGPGSIFWMWLIAIIGAGSSFVESTLAQIYKSKDEHGFRGGPAYYMEKGLKKRWLGVVFSILITVTFGLIFNSVQSNTITLAFEQAFGVKRMVVGIVLVAFTALIIFGGVKRIAKAVEIIVPIMAVAYIGVALFVVLKNVTFLPQVFKAIFSNAFSMKSAFGGVSGGVIMTGIKRGLFSNEAGMGSAPNAAASASVTHPVKQGLIQTLGVFTDTLLICSCTAFIVLISGMYTNSKLEGIQLTQLSLSSQVGAWGSTFIAICILLFAYSSIIGNYYYGQTNIEFLNGKKIWLILYRIFVLGMVLFGSVVKVQIVWNMADLFMGMMAIINLLAIWKLSPIAFAALKDYKRQKEQGKNPVFNVNNIDELVEAECWEVKDLEELNIEIVK